LYEGYAPHGVPVIVVAATDNPTRTVANVRVAFRKGNGNMGNSGSVIFNFKKVGAFRLAPEGLDLEALELDLIDFGLEEMGEGTGEKNEPQVIVRCDISRFGDMQQAIEARKIVPISSGVEYLPLTPTQLPEDQAKEVLTMVDLLEQDDDVQDVFHSLA
jgi:transcriptional/translational regulatory protein YebC/TACO1